ncbi:ArsR/SmtB family transcription factor [Nocardioides mesophilus]|uniref:Winged helix-turn-helix transcriptional regulator n=1 Tax=Nocardioides mesophilus TaxID=433659 RepID=A0A7G9RD33_9ACTN|nr:winged helix-turn-helix domain-containing protein [Nocardioides mesophilus]QNN53508.1 winged helix-turn-helix transcriptional regulator [Nocardioides mesophilus]
MTGDPREVASMRATAHPVRLQILSLLTGADLSAAEIARELDLSHANASYHLRVLADAGLVVEAGEEKIRGGVAKRYRHPWDQTPSVEPGGSATSYVAAMAAELVRRYGPGRRRGFLADAEMWVTPQTWEQVRTLVQEASRLVHAEAQPPRTPGTLHVNLTAAAFEMDEQPGPATEVPA